MKKPVASLALILAAGLFAASVQAATVTEQIQTTVRTLVTQWNAGNVKAAAATFGDDAQIAGEGMPAAVTGRAAIDKKFAELMSDTRSEEHTSELQSTDVSRMPSSA
mgnify:CR=1 FL=1